MRVFDFVARSLPATLLFVLVLSAIAVALGVATFGLTIAGAMALYFVVWWTALFAVLPFGARSQAESGDILPGSDPGAPALPALNEKAIWTTIVAAVVFTIVGWLLPLTGL
jgi:predicted secreted protein